VSARYRVSSWVVLSLGELAFDKDDRVVLLFLAGGGLEERGNRCSGIVLDEEAIVRGLRSAPDEISSIVSPAFKYQLSYRSWVSVFTYRDILCSKQSSTGTSELSKRPDGGL
jgi:hypothetical protein